jgi:hypothetical protein
MKLLRPNIESRNPSRGFTVEDFAREVAKKNQQRLNEKLEMDLKNQSASSFCSHRPVAPGQQAMAKDITPSTIVIGTCLTSMSFGGLPGVNSPSTSFGGVAKVTGRQRTKWVCFRSRMSAFVAVVTPLEPAGMGCAPIIVEFLKLLSLISRRK